MKKQLVLFIAGLVVCMSVPALADDSGADVAPPDSVAAMPVDGDQGKSYAVNCYQGKPDEGLNLGSLTVTAPSEAGPACNATYYDCHDKCYGCFSGPDGQTCTDNFGGTLKR